MPQKEIPQKLSTLTSKLILLQGSTRLGYLGSPARLLIPVPVIMVYSSVTMPVEELLVNCLSEIQRRGFTQRLDISLLCMNLVGLSAPMVQVGKDITFILPRSHGFFVVIPLEQSSSILPWQPSQIYTVSGACSFVFCCTYVLLEERGSLVKLELNRGDQRGFSWVTQFQWILSE